MIDGYVVAVFGACLLVCVVALWIAGSRRP